MTDRLQVLVCPRCGNSDVIFKEVDPVGGTVTLGCSACPNVWPEDAPSPEAVPELVRLGGQLEVQRNRAEVRRALGQTTTAVQWEGRATRTSLAIRDLLEGAAA